MQKKMYCIFDSKAQIYHAPFYKSTHGEAERDFQSVSRDPQSTISQYPEDFDLFYIGEFDDETGKVSPLSAIQHIIKANQFKKPESRVQ